MGVLSKKELATHAGVGQSTVTAAIKDGRIICSMQEGKSVIDPKDKHNSAQILMWKNRTKRSNSVNTEKNPNKIKVHKPKLTEAQKLDLEKKRLSIEQQRETLEKLRLEKRRLSGDMVPTESVRSLFKLLGSSFQKTYKSQSENLLNELIHRAKIDPAIAAEFRSRNTDMINEAHLLSVEGAKKSLVQVVKGQTSKK